MNCDWCPAPAVWIMRSLEQPSPGPCRLACRSCVDASLLDALHDGGVKPFAMGIAAVEVTLIAPPARPSLTLPAAAVTPELA